MGEPRQALDVTDPPPRVPRRVVSTTDLGEVERAAGALNVVDDPDARAEDRHAVRREERREPVRGDARVVRAEELLHRQVAAGRHAAARVEHPVEVVVPANVEMAVWRIRIECLNP